jgi:hypothetical protein
MPPSTVMMPRSGSNATTRFRSRVSSSRLPVPNCWPPIAWRPPAIDTDRPVACASASAARTSSRPRGLTIAATRVGLSCACTSLTSSLASGSGMAEPFGERTGIGRAMQPVSGAAAISAEAEVLRNARRPTSERLMLSR